MNDYYGRFVDADELRERMLDALKLQYLGAKTSEDRRDLFNQMRALIKGRSQQAIHRLEVEKGLRSGS